MYMDDFDHIKNSSNKNKELGFTLIELMVVIAIVAILSAIAVPNLLTWVCRSRSTEASDFHAQIFVAIHGYAENEDLQRLNACNGSPSFSSFQGSAGDWRCLGVDIPSLKPGRRYQLIYNAFDSGGAAATITIPSDIAPATTCTGSVTPAASNMQYVSIACGNIDGDPDLDITGLFYDRMVKANCQMGNAAGPDGTSPFTDNSCEAPPVGRDCMD
ncbi:MAG: hypothetical protein Kow0090_17200 [Myxococcota bacterium]